MASPGYVEPSNAAAVERYRALLQVSESIASHRDLQDLFRSLAALLGRLATFDFICLTLPDPARNTVRKYYSSFDELRQNQLKSEMELMWANDPLTQRLAVDPAFSESTVGSRTPE